MPAELFQLGKYYLWQMLSEEYHFNQKELSLAANAEIMLTKNEMINKVVNRLAEIAEMLKLAYTQSGIHKNESVVLSPKISRGEQYKGLPYVMLDFPRIFSKNDVLAIRTMWWWGNGFTVMLHLKGKYLQEAVPKLLKKFNGLKQQYISITTDEWDHAIAEPGFIPIGQVSEIEFSALLQQRQFIKLATKFKFSEWNNSQQLIADTFITYLQLIE